MKRAVVLLAVLLAPASAWVLQTAAAASPDAAIHAAEAWAFPKPHSPDTSLPKASQVAKPDPHAPMHVPGSTRTYTRAELAGGFEVADWFPQNHPPMPHIVAFGRKPAYACAACHNAGGEGYPASASLSGLSVAYLREQLQAFRDGQRYNDVMAKEARNLDQADEQAAIAYFSGLKFTPHVRMMEAASVPKTHWSGDVLAPNKNGAREPIGERIVEVAPEDGEHGSEHVVYTAYVPPGSIAAGEQIAAHGAGTAPSCESCHGAALQGVGDIPYLAGRSPTFIVRELILFRLGKRTNAGAAPMVQEVSHLTLKDMIDVAAYAASRAGSKNDAVRLSADEAVCAQGSVTGARECVARPLASARPLALRGEKTNRELTMLSGVPAPRPATAQTVAIPIKSASEGS
ncbi:cytochrome C-binding protein [Rhodanobacter sp. DHB23]|uniref:c-type cytochrome n=1 Tax=Rhodanobacter sp. DHB23 TaxID=2775923 RepID=UPI001785037C|nr:cytochrome C-binding protein [Rhodanobacter sp. DHB23]MBD8874056.1 cytochrome C-binding protein [Rhodanobacter sp. DHB23]